MKNDSNEYQTFLSDLAKDGFHIFNRQHAKEPGFYPNEFPSFPRLGISEIQEGDRITVRAFFSNRESPMSSIECGQIDLEVECVDRDAKMMFGNILTELPESFALAKGTTIELWIDEVLSIQGRQ